MRYILLNWIETEHWEGALIQDENGKKFLTAGIYKWEPNTNRQFKVVEDISNKEDFNRRWSENFPYDELIQDPAERRKELKEFKRKVFYS